MTHPVDTERAWWRRADLTNIWGIGTWADGVAACSVELDPILSPLPPGATVLDLGCGPGRLLTPFARRYPHLVFVGVDVRDYSTYVDEPNVSVVVNDGRVLPLERDSLDAAYSVALFQHLPHTATIGYLAELGSCVRPGGRIRFQHVLGTENSFLSHQCDRDRLSAWCEMAGFKVTAVDVGQVHYQWVWVTAERAR